MATTQVGLSTVKFTERHRDTIRGYLEQHGRGDWNGWFDLEYRTLADASAPLHNFLAPRHYERMMAEINRQEMKMEATITNEQLTLKPAARKAEIVELGGGLKAEIVERTVAAAKVVKPVKEKQPSKAAVAATIAVLTDLGGTPTTAAPHDPACFCYACKPSVEEAVSVASANRKAQKESHDKIGAELDRVLAAKRAKPTMMSLAEAMEKGEQIELPEVPTVSICQPCKLEFATEEEMMKHIKEKHPKVKVVEKKAKAAKPASANGKSAGRAVRKIAVEAVLKADDKHPVDEAALYQKVQAQGLDISAKSFHFVIYEVSHLLSILAELGALKA